MLRLFRPSVHRRLPNRTRIGFSMAIFLAFAAFGVRLNAQDTGNKLVGIVVSIRPHPGQPLAGPVILKAAGSEERRLGEGEFVSENDEIIVPNRDAIVVISQSRGSLTICDPEVVTDKCRARANSPDSYLSPIGKFYDAVVRITSRFGNYGSSASTLSTRSYEEPGGPRMDFDESKVQRIAVGERAFWLNWSGGQPPFRVSLRPGTGPTVSGTSVIPEITLKPIRITAGTIDLTIEDDLGRKFATKLTALERLPIAPDYSASAPTKELARYLAAAWLSQQGGGTYRIEAAQRLSSLASTLSVANSLRRGLLVAEPN